MLRRKAEVVLENWLECGQHTALCLLGARQTGKSTLAQAFGHKHFAHTLLLDFIADKQACKIFEKTDDVQSILLGLQTYADFPMEEGKTLVILDEIQECPAARTAIKYLVQDGRYRYIETGSLLGVRIHEIRSYPVGFEQLVSLYPLDFEEFAWAVGVQTSVIEQLRTCFEQKTAIPEAVHERLLQLFYQYTAVGGMPEVVQSFVQNRSMQQVQEIQKRILDLYKLDITQYAARTERLKIQDIYSSIPSQLNEKNMRFFLSEVSKDARLNRYEGSLVWLIEAGTVLPSYAVTQPVLPLLLYSKRNMFRLFMNDTGLLCAALGSGIQHKLLMKDHASDFGAIFENVFAQLLSANGFQLYYYNAKKTGEVDFVLENNGTVQLVEIKSGQTWKEHAALNKVLKEPNWQNAEAFVFCQDTEHQEGRIRYLPWYMVMFFAPANLTTEMDDFNWESLSFPS